MTDTSYSAILASDAALTQALVTIRGTDQKPSLTFGDLKTGVYYIRLQNAAGLRSQTYRFDLYAIRCKPCLTTPRRCKPSNTRVLLAYQLGQSIGLKGAFKSRVPGQAIFASLAVMSIFRQLFNRLPEQCNLLILCTGAVDQTLHGE